MIDAIKDYFPISVQDAAWEVIFGISWEYETLFVNN